MDPEVKMEVMEEAVEEALPPPLPPMIAVYSHKGGVGKTTVAYTIADSMHGFTYSNGINQINARLNKNRILMIDLDPQMNLTTKILTDEATFEQYFNGLQPNFHRSNKDVKSKLNRVTNAMLFHDVNPNPMVLHAANNRVCHFIPGNADLGPLTAQMDLEVNNPNAPPNNLMCLKNLVRAYHAVHNYDLVLLDLGPDLYVMNKVALLSCDYVLVPCTADLYSAMSFRLLRSLVFQDPLYVRMQSGLKILGFLCNRVKVYAGVASKFEAQLELMQERFETHLADPLVPANNFMMPNVDGFIGYIEDLASQAIDVNRTSLIRSKFQDKDKGNRVLQQVHILIRRLNLV